VALVLIGSSHQYLPLAELERFERFTEPIRNALFGRVAKNYGISGGVVVATCNRFELYLEAERFHEAVDQTIALIADVSGLGIEYCSQVLRVSYESTVVQHLFNLTAGLDSMIIGEVEVAGQVREAFKQAQRRGESTSRIEFLFQRALATSKKVKTSTDLGAAGRSIAHVALQIVEQKHWSLNGKRALILGTGAYARVVVGALQSMGCLEIEVYSASGRARRFSDTHGTIAIDSEGLSQSVAKADLVIACSGTGTHLIDARLIQESRTGTSVLPILDLALSSDVAADVHALQEVDVIDLEAIGKNAPSERGDAISAARAIVQQAVSDFESALTSRSTDPLVALMRAHVGLLITDETDRVRRRSGEDAAIEVSHSLHRVTNALLHTPSIRARELALNGNEDAYRRAIQLLFDIDVDEKQDV
jgi:glutamyl-tRNA reductase